MSGGSTIQLTINGELHTVASDEAVNTRLITFIRDRLNIKGTHYTCLQGGCGACTVVATTPDLATGGTTTFSINSCLASLYNCDGWSITTVEGLGNKDDGYHVIQERLAEHYGTQCGYCSPGMVMNMYGLTQSKETWTEEDVEKNLDGHICRCTGYRPILDAFKSITPADIEDIGKSSEGCCKSGATKPAVCAGGCKSGAPKPSVVGGCCQSGRATAAGGCCKGQTRTKKEISVDGVTFYSPTTTQELVTIVDGLPDGTDYQLIFGNTALGVTGEEHHDVIIATRNITELSSVSVTTAEVTAGAAVSISTLMAAFKNAQLNTGFEYLKHIDDHWQKVASTSVRNLGGWAGNLALRVHRPNFASDIFLTLVACGAEVLIEKDGSTAWNSVESLPNKNLEANRQVMLRLRFLPLTLDTYYRSYKVMPRSANALALINAAHRLRVDTAAAFTVSETPTLVYEGINSTFVRAVNTENYLTGKSLANVSVLQGALAILAEEVVPDADPLDPDPQYKKDVAQALLYKTILSIISEGGNVDPSILSGASMLTRPLSSGTQTYDDNAATWPLGQPVPKLESKAQCAGEANYVNDAPAAPNELYGVFVQSTLANAAIASIDPSAALAVPGVTGFVSAEDIPGQNNIQPFDAVVQPMFASGRVNYHGQAIGLLVGTDVDVVKKAVDLVVVTYTDEKVPVLTIAEALANPLPPDQRDPVVVGDVAVGFAESTHIIEGAMSRDGQYHFHMESHASRVVPTESGFEVTAATQYPFCTQSAIGQVLGIESNTIDVTVKRLGGGFGAKIYQCNLVSTAAALAAYKFRKPVRVALELQANMTIAGWRDPFYYTYKVGLDDNGLLKAVQSTSYGDAGYIPADATAPWVSENMFSCYQCDNWDLTPRLVLTDTASNTWCRTPCTVEGISFIENIMEHAAKEMGMDPLEIRKINLIPDGGKRLTNILPVRVRNYLRESEFKSDRSAGMKMMTITKNLIGDMISQIEQEANVAERKAEIAQFNLDNRWRKRGLSVMPMLWPYTPPAVYGFGVFVAVNGHDGSVIVAHGGIEMGQGINTKVAQVVAHTLGCDLDQVVVKPTTMVSGANSSNTGGCCGSDINSHCVLQAATKLRGRLDAVALPGDTWQKTAERAHSLGFSLSEFYWNGAAEVKSYPVFGVACTEVELDTLTGQFLVLQTDIIEDAGTSISPLVDIGQVEGSWVFGQGLFTTEGPKYDPATGAKLTNDTWHYKPPLALDIPTDLRVTLLSNAPNPDGVLSSKVTNEPPLCLAFAVVMALRDAVASARADAGATEWFQMDTPLTVDKVQQLCLVDPQQFSFTRSKGESSKEKSV